MEAISPSVPPELVRAFRESTTPEGMRVSLYALSIEQVPADFYADPDGCWTFESLARASGFSAEKGVAVGALRECFNGHPDGSAVVTLNAESRPYVAIIECPIAYRYVRDAEHFQVSAA